MKQPKKLTKLDPVKLEKDVNKELETLITQERDGTGSKGVPYKVSFLVRNSKLAKEIQGLFHESKDMTKIVADIIFRHHISEEGIGRVKGRKTGTSNSTETRILERRLRGIELEKMFEEEKAKHRERTRMTKSCQKSWRRPIMTRRIESEVKSFKQRREEIEARLDDDGRCDLQDYSAKEKYPASVCRGSEKSSQPIAVQPNILYRFVGPR